jgi:hypothetical protein
MFSTNTKIKLNEVPYVPYVVCSESQLQYLSRVLGHLESMLYRHI